MTPIVEPNGPTDSPDVVVVSMTEVEKETARVAAIRARIDGISSLPQQHAHDQAAAIGVVLARLGMLTVMPDEFGEFTEEARMAVSATSSALELLRDTKHKREQEEHERDVQQLADAILQSRRVTEEAQQKKSMLVIRNMQKMSAQQGCANDLQLAIDAIGARSITEEEFGLGAPFVKLAQGCALDKLRPRYEQAVITEMAQQLRKIAREEYGNLGDLADAIPEGHDPEDKLLTIIAYSYLIAAALGAPAHILDVLSDPEDATNEQIDAMLPFAAGYSAYEMEIAQAVRDACFKVAVDCEEGHEFAAITNLNLDSIISEVKEKA